MQTDNEITNAPDVEALKKILEKEGGPIVGIELREFRKNLFIVCQCGNADGNRFSKYLRGGSGKPENTFIMCDTCEAVRPWAAHAAQMQGIATRWREELRKQKETMRQTDSNGNAVTGASSDGPAPVTQPPNA